MKSSASVSAIAEHYAGESARIRREFQAGGNGRRAALGRAALVDAVVAGLCASFISPQLKGPEGFCLVALGGYGRRELFPHSDVDLLFLSADGRAEKSCREGVATLVRTLWDLRLRLGHSTRTLSECARLDRDNLEFNIALLDSRYLAGDPWLFARLHDDLIPHLVGRDGAELVRGCVDMTRHRHEKHGDTIYHLEPNLKEAPGGFRDYQVACWLALIAGLDKQARWVRPEEHWPAALATQSRGAVEFLSTARCFLHYHFERDGNQLTYECQELAASWGIGGQVGQALPATDWMRTYFLHARAVQRLTHRMVEEIAPARSSLYSLYQDWRSRLSNADFSVLRGRIFPRQPALLRDVDLLLDLFEMVARHGIELSGEAERWVEESVAELADDPGRFPQLWPRFRRILVLPHAADALRAMHRLGLLVSLFPEWRAIDCLVVRDFYHRYTVDEHSLMTIQNLHALRGARAESGPAPAASGEPGGGWARRFSELLGELERPELLYFSLLLHDVGKGMPSSKHIEGSLQAAESIFARLALEPEERETVRFLISNHLEMSRILLRDIFDPETVRSFAEEVGTPERLKMLALLTYADVQAVNLEALTPWKAEMLWQLYVAASNHLTRSLDEERVHAAPGSSVKVQRVLACLSPSVPVPEVNGFLEGFPKRYLETHSAEEVAAHFALARRLAASPAEVVLRARERFYELTVLTRDRPFLFASLAGTLAAWGMNILKADAFSNSAGTVLDVFRFVDLFRTLELNPPEVERFKECVVDVLAGKVSLTALMNGRVNPRAFRQAKVRVPTQIRFDDSASSHSTLLELITQDRPGLLYEVSSVLALLACNIEVALIDTEGQKVIDVFYLIFRGSKLEPEKQDEVRQALQQRLATSPPATS
jgi:[protein-PII] uridylyltransferase